MVIFSVAFVHDTTTHQITLTHPVTLTIPNGMRFDAAMQLLADKDLLTRPKVMTWVGRLKGWDRQIKTGVYEFHGSYTAYKVIEILTKGKVVQHQITLVEGLTFRQWLMQMAEVPLIQATLKPQEAAIQAWFQPLAERYQLPIPHPEGWFFPDTYQYTANDSDAAILERALKKMVATLSEQWAQRADGLPYQTPYEALIMGSIIEKETGVAAERPRIASVFVNRLNKKMRLQTDPTVIYGIGETFDGNITRQHLKQKTPYNTYVIKGLPPTPIAMVSLASLHAALHPAEDPALYFVSKGDGTHQFSETLQAHNKAVRQFQLKK